MTKTIVLTEWHYGGRQTWFKHRGLSLSQPWPIPTSSWFLKMYSGNNIQFLRSVNWDNMCDTFYTLSGTEVTLQRCLLLIWVFYQWRSVNLAKAMRVPIKIFFFKCICTENNCHWKEIFMKTITLYKLRESEIQWTSTLSAAARSCLRSTEVSL